MNKSLLPKNTWLIMYGIAALALPVSYFFTLRNVISFTEGVSFLILAEAFLLIYSYLLHKTIAKGSLAPEKLFLLLFIPLSIGMMISLPLGRAPDEIAHVERSWQISIGEWIPTSKNKGVFYVPEGLISGFLETTSLTLQQMINMPNQHLSDSLIASNTLSANTGVYPINNYMPQGLGIFIMRLLTNNRIWILYGARFGAWALTTILFYYAIRKLPAGQYSCIAITLFPMMLQEAVSASADGLTCSAAFAFFAFILHTIAKKPTLGIKDFLILLLLAHFVTTFKLMYAPLVFLIYLIPLECFGSKKKKMWIVNGILIISLFFTFGWLLLCKKLYIDPAGESTRYAGNVYRHLSLILTNPLGYLWLIVKTFVVNFFSYASGMIGRRLSWLNISIPEILTAIELVIILGIFISDQNLICSHPFKTFTAVFATCAASAFLVFTALYIWWTPLGATLIDGVQGRYFLPLLPCVLISAKANLKSRFSDSDRQKLVSFLGMICLCIIFSVLMQTIA